MKHLILLRHGQSLWNLDDRFTGWTDVGLSEQGRKEAAVAGKKIAASGIFPRYCFTSYLRRAIHTLDIALDSMDRCWLPVIKDWHLNERHYGALQGLNKAATARKAGAEQVQKWRRGYDVVPPAVTTDDERFPGHDPRYASVPTQDLPLAESLEMTIARVRPCWEELIVPALNLYGDVIVAAHGNSLRGLAMMLLGISEDNIAGLEIPTGAPWLFTLDDRLNVVSERYL